MLKFLRKYNKVILAVGGSLLMVVFLLPQAIQQLGMDPRGRVVATLEGEQITNGDLFEARRELDLAKQIVPELVNAAIVIRNADHWILMEREAREAGLIGGPSDGPNALVEAARVFAEFEMNRRQMPAQFREASRQRFLDEALARGETRREMVIRGGTPAEVVDGVLAKVRGMLRLTTMYFSNITVMPEQELARRAEELLETVLVEAVSLGPEAVEGELPEITGARLEEHFQRYRDVIPSEDPNGIGYMRPPAVRLEYLTVPRQAISSAVELDPVEVNRFWREVRSEDPTRYNERFAAARPAVERDLRREKTNEILGAVDEVIRKELALARRELRTVDGYRVLPEDWSEVRPSLEGLADAVETMLSRRFGIEGVRPGVTESDGEWLALNDMQALEGIGASFYQFNPQTRIPFPQYVINVRELDGNPQLGVQAGLVYGPLERGRQTATPDSDHYYFRVLDVRELGPAESLAEVRERAEEDLRVLDALAYFEERSGEIADRLAPDLRAGAAEMLGRPAEEVGVRRLEVTRRSVSLGGLGLATRVPVPELDVELFRDAVMGLVEGVDPTTVVSELPADRRTVGVAVPSARALVVAKMTGWYPVSREAYRTAYAAVRSDAFARFRQTEEFDRAFSFDRMAERHDYVRLDEEEEDAAAEEAEASPEAERAAAGG